MADVVEKSQKNIESMGQTLWRANLRNYKEDYAKAKFNGDNNGGKGFRFGDSMSREAVGFTEEKHREEIRKKMKQGELF